MRDAVASGSGDVVAVKVGNHSFRSIRTTMMFTIEATKENLEFLLGAVARSVILPSHAASSLTFCHSTNQMYKFSNMQTNRSQYDAYDRFWH